MINEMVSDVIKTTQKNIKLNNIKNLKDIYRSQNKIVCFSKRMEIFDEKIKFFLMKKMYLHKSVNNKTNYGKNIIKNLFTLIKKNPKKYINISKYKNLSIERIICDYIAGMTDRYAINLYKKIK
jgi:dGTPase